MKLIHFADLHLDAPFAWLAGSPDLARERRQSLRETLLNILTLARKEAADVILCGGDLFEHERVTPDTADFLRTAFASVAPVPIFIAPGNHDWFGPASIYSQVEWSPNVHIFQSAELAAVEIGDEITLWGAAHCAPANTDNFLSTVTVRGQGLNLALFHGSERGWLVGQESGKSPHAPFDADDIRRAGIDFAFLGHFHTPKDSDTFTYPGNPDPLTFGETGERGVVVATVEPGRPVSIRRQRVAKSAVMDATVDVSGLTNRQQIRDAVISAAAQVNGFVRVTLVGELAQDIEIHLGELAQAAGRRAQVRTGRLHTGYNFEAIGAERTIRGQFVRDVLAADGLDDELRQRVVVMGLRALDGRHDLEVS